MRRDCSGLPWFLLSGGRARRGPRQDLGGTLPGPAIGGEHVVERGGRAAAERREHAADAIGDGGKSNSLLEESLHRHLVRGVQDGGKRPAPCERGVGQTERGKAIAVGRFELE